jgi:hypothetical protein
MIDSVIWKEKLEQDLSLLKKRFIQRRWSYKSLVLFERELTFIFFSIRSLLDAEKLTDSLSKKEYPCIIYPNEGKIVDELSKYHPDESFNLDGGIDRKLSLRFLTNQFIHAYVIMLGFSEKKRVTDVLLCSDKEKSEILIKLPISIAIDIVQDVISDEIISIHLQRNKKTGELRKVQIS